MSDQGYYRFPDVRDETVVFVSEDDLWEVSVNGGIARRLTANLSHTMFPKISPDGKWLAFGAAEEGYGEIFLMNRKGGKQKRLTYLGAISRPLGWSADSRHIYITSNFEQAFDSSIYKLAIEGGEPQKIPVGNANQISISGNICVIGRHTRDSARWKRYKGGTCGELWIDTTGKGNFRKLIDLNSNLVCPMIIGKRVFFISDHEGIGNIYSCDLNGKRLIRYTSHNEFYVRNAATDGRRIVYHAGADIYYIDLKKRKKAYLKLNIEYHSSQNQTNRKFIDPHRYLQGYDLSTKGTHTAAAVRGKIASMANWSGPVRQRGKKNGVRYRLPTWLADEKHLVATTDEIDGEDRILLIDSETGSEEILDKLPVGRIHRIFPSPKENKIILTNHKNEILLLDCDKKTLTTLDKSDYERIDSADWSPDGKWLCYDFSNTMETRIIKITEVSTGKTHEITKPVRYDFSPVFSADGKFIFFISDRTFYPVYDSVQFELSFLKTAKLYAVPLKKEQQTPFVFQPKAPAGEDENGKKEKDKDKVEVEVDLADIEKRLFEFPIQAGDYHSLQACEKKVIFLENPREGLKKDGDDWLSEPEPNQILKCFDLVKLQEETLLKDISSFKLSLNGKNMIVRKKGELSIYKSGEKPKPKEKVKKKYSLESGAVDLSRLKIGIDPREEWKQMYREAWLLQREHFWNENMSGIDWKLVYNRYYPLLNRVGSRGEFSDLIWEMQGELGTSHCYEFGGDYRKHPRYPLGKLGCSYRLSKDGTYFIFKDIYFGDPADENEISPLAAAGVNIKKGDHLLAVNGTEVNKDVSPRHLLVNLSGQEVTLTVRAKGQKKTREVTIKTLKFESPVLYRSWVEKNREYVHKYGKGMIGYVHIPDMGIKGFSEFHRYYLTECRYDALLVDVRYNGGGHVSRLLLEKLNRKIIGYDATRWSKEPYSYPDSAVSGPMVALTNEFAGSDGDIFSHSFKLMKLGKLIGKRTWGGVIGINGQYSLVDGSITTQPEYSFWFKDVGWGVENYGTDPDIEVDIQPQDYATGNDPQLDKAITVLLEELKKNPVIKPKLDKRPDLSLPKLKKVGKRR